MSKDSHTSGLDCHASSGTSTRPQHVADADVGSGKLTGDGLNSSDLAADCGYGGLSVENKSRLALAQSVERLE